MTGYCARCASPADPKPDYMPTMDEVHRFIKSNPLTSFEMLAEITGIGDYDNAPVSGDRFRELWKLGGGAFAKGRAWVEIETLPFVLCRIVDTINKLPPERAALARLTGDQSKTEGAKLVEK